MDGAENEIIKRISAGYSIPPLSAVALKLLDAATDEKASLNDMSLLIKEDPALTVRLLKLANSPFYRIPTEVSTIEEAVMRIGCNNIRLMALSISIRDTFPFARHEQIDYEQFWVMSLYRAILSRVIAQNLQNCDPEEAFVAGLVLEIGILIFFDLLIKGKDRDFVINFFPLEDLLNLQEQRYGVNHRKVGETALRFWRLPGSIIECQRFYPGSHYPVITPLASVCEIARQCSEFIVHKDLDWNSFYGRAKNEYNLNQETISGIMVESLNAVESIAEGMKISINRDGDINFLIGKAQESLKQLSSQINSMHYKCHPAFNTFKTAGTQPLITETLQAVAHEIRNPLTILGGFARRLEKILNPSSKEWDYVQQIIEESKRLENVLTVMTTGKL